MVFNIRYGFETNSSSAHSFGVLKQGADYTREEILESCGINPSEQWDGYIWFYSNDLSFGRAPFRILTGFYDKLCYLIAAYGKDLINDPENNAQYDILKDSIRELLPDFEGFRAVDEDSGSWDWEWSGIDDQSEGLFQEFLEKNSISFTDYLSSSRYIVVIDGDEYYYFNTMLADGIIHKEDFEILDRW